MSKASRYGSLSRIGSAPFRLRPFAYSAAMAAALAFLFQPVPAMAAPTPAPTVPAGQAAPVAVPDAGSRPVLPGALVLPGAPAPGGAAAGGTAISPVTSLTVASTDPVVQKIERGRAEIATLGDQLIRVGQDRDIAKNQVLTADQRLLAAQDSLRTAQSEAVEAAAAAMREAAALPPGVTSPGLLDLDLDDLARLQRGDTTSDSAALQRLEAAKIGAQLAIDEQAAATRAYSRLAAEWTKLNSQLTRKQAAQQRLELDNAPALSAAETSQNAVDQQLGTGYLAGSESGRSADPRAVEALKFALAQRGDPYVWSEEGPDQYDCSGLMFAAYRKVGFPLVRVSRDQYYQTRNKAVSRYSLLPGDLLFFSSSNSWTGIHHVAMYAGDGMMVEAPRTGLNVRLTPVRWTRLFQATRIFGSIEGDTELPDLGPADPEPEETGGTRPKPGATSPATSPSPSPSRPGKPSPSATTPGKPSPSATTPGKPSPSATTPGKPSPSATTPGKPSPSATTPGKPSPSATTPGKPSPSASTPANPSPSTSPAKPAPTPTPTQTSSQPVKESSPVSTSKAASSSNAAESSSSSSATATVTATTKSVSPSPSASSDD